MIGIYLITNTIDGKRYVGQSSDIEKRWASHKTSALYGHDNMYVHKAMRKHGIENFTIETLEVIEEYDTAILGELEEKYIIEYDTRSKNKRGYNQRTGGVDGWKHAEETKKTIGEKNRVNMMGKQNALGHKKSEESKQRMSETQTCEITVYFEDGSIKDFGKTKAREVAKELGIGKDMVGELANGRPPYMGITRIEMTGGSRIVNRKPYRNARTYMVYLKDGTTETFQGHRRLNEKYKSCKVGYIPVKLQNIIEHIEIVTFSV